MMVLTMSLENVLCANDVIDGGEEGGGGNDCKFGGKLEVLEVVVVVEILEHSGIVVSGDKGNGGGGWFGGRGGGGFSGGSGGFGWHDGFRVGESLCVNWKDVDTGGFTGTGAGLEKSRFEGEGWGVLADFISDLLLIKGDWDTSVPDDNEGIKGVASVGYGYVVVKDVVEGIKGVRGMEENVETEGFIFSTWDDTMPGFELLESPEAVDDPLTKYGVFEAMFIWIALTLSNSCFTISLAGFPP